MSFSVGLQGAAMSQPVSYTLRFPAPHTHYVEVEARFPAAGQPAIELTMPVWTPGSYLVREFSRNVEDLAAATEHGEPLAVTKTRKNRWRVETRGQAVAVVRYRVYGREMSVRTDFVDAGFALLNGAPTFLTLADGVRRPHRVKVELPPSWKVVVSPLPPAPGTDANTSPGTYLAEDYDELVDSPIYAGNAAVYSFEVGGKPHLLVNEGEGGIWDGPRSAADVEKIVREQAAFWGTVPYPRYVFFNLLVEGSGGLEHRDSCVLMASRWQSRNRDGYHEWLGLVSHELFHAWNVKRMRPIELGPFDYDQEVYTRSLWMAEGMTSYYDELLLYRAGLATRPELLKKLSKQIESLQTAPGRLVQPVEEASFDAWIKYYRRDENFVNTGVSYYTKGALIAFLLDAKIRRATQGHRSLDDALRLLDRRFSGERGFRPEELRAVLEEVAGIDLDPWLDRVLTTTEELDYRDVLDAYGLRFGEGEADNGKEGEKTKPKEPAAWLGADTEVQSGRLMVTQIKRGTPAWDSGLNVGDEILAIGDFRVLPDGWKDRLKAYRPGTQESLLVARRERLMRVSVVFAEEPRSVWRLEVAPDATAEQKARFEAWLHGGAEEETETDRGPATLLETHH
jgi:predicted metalloprotease with PDZ domain